MVSLGRLSVGQPTGRGGGVYPPRGSYTNTSWTVVEVLQKKQPDTQVSLVGNLTCAAFKEYDDVP